jgi:hypothetical protein
MLKIAALDASYLATESGFLATVIISARQRTLQPSSAEQ